MLEEKTLDDILAAWSKEFQKQDPNYERILKRKSKDNLIQTISLEGNVSENVRPWNYDDFLYRIRTYKSSTWFAKPLIISPPFCSRFGWINVSCDKLKCESCHAEIIHELNDLSGEKFAKKLVASHDPMSCGWINNETQTNFSPESFLHFPSLTLDHKISDFQSRFISWTRSLLSLPLTSPSLQLVTPPEILRWASFRSLIAESFPALPLDSQHATATESCDSGSGSGERQGSSKGRLRIYLTNILKNSERQAYLASAAVSSSALPSSSPTDEILLKAFLLSLYCWTPSLQTSQPSPSSFALVSTCSLCSRSFHLPASLSSSRSVNPSQEHKYYCPVVLSYRPPLLETGSGYKMRAQEDYPTIPSGSLQMIETVLMNSYDWKITEEILRENPEALPISSFTVHSPESNGYGNGNGRLNKRQRPYSHDSILLSDTTTRPTPNREEEGRERDKERLQEETIDQKYKKIRSVLSMLPSSASTSSRRSSVAPTSVPSSSFGLRETSS